MGSAQATSTLEPEGLTGNDGKRPDGMTLASWKHGKSLAWDFTCVDTLADSYIHLTTQGPGKAAEKAEKGKLAKYEDLTHNFIVIQIEACLFNPA